MTTNDTYARGSHAPCEHFAQVGYDHLAARLSAADHNDSADPYPDDAAEDESPGAQSRWFDRRVLAALLSGAPPAKKSRVAKGSGDDAPAGVEEKPVELAGVRLDWHVYLPEMKVWAGQATLASLVAGRVAALRVAGGVPDGKSLLAWTVPLKKSSGLDGRTVVTALDAGFSPYALGMPVACFAAAELLMCVGLQLAPVTRFGRKRYGYADPDGGWWRFAIDDRAGYYRVFGPARRAGPPLPAGA